MVTLKPLDRDAKEPYATKVGFFDDGVPAQARLIVAFKTGTALAQLLGIPPIQKGRGQELMKPTIACTRRANCHGLLPALLACYGGAYGGADGDMVCQMQRATPTRALCQQDYLNLHYCPYPIYAVRQVRLYGTPYMDK